MYLDNYSILHLQYLLDKVHKQCSEVNRLDLFTTVLGRRSLRDENEVSRVSKLQFHLFYDKDFAINIDLYNPAQDTWTEFIRFNYKIADYTAIFCYGKLVIMGGRDAQHFAVNVVNIRDTLFWFYVSYSYLNYTR